MSTKPQPKHFPSGLVFRHRGGLPTVTLIAMGCVKPANDDEEFYRWRSFRDVWEDWGRFRQSTQEAGHASLS